MLLEFVREDSNNFNGFLEQLKEVEIFHLPELEQHHEASDAGLDEIQAQLLSADLVLHNLIKQVDCPLDVFVVTGANIEGSLIEFLEADEIDGALFDWRIGCLGNLMVQEAAREAVNVLESVQNFFVGQRVDVVSVD